MIKRLFKDSVFHVQYWYMKEILRAKKQGVALGNILKYYIPYMKSNLDYDKSPLILGVPWVTFEAIDFLKEIVRPEMKVFEFGSGGSTRFFAERVAEVHSVEHHEGWYQKVASELHRHTHLDLRWIPGMEPTEVLEKRYEDESNDGLDYSSYASAISKFKDGYFDLILVDGKARNACIASSLPKLRPGGWLLVDNSNRKAYSKTLGNLDASMVLKSYGPSLGSKKFTQTSFYKIA